MKRFVLELRQAVSRFNAPPALTSLASMGFSSERGTLTMAASLNTASASLSASLTVLAFRTSPLTSLNPRLFLQCCRFSSLPVDRLSRTVTSTCWSDSLSARWLPMKPAPPAMRTWENFAVCFMAFWVGEKGIYGCRTAGFGRCRSLIVCFRPEKWWMQDKRINVWPR